MLSSNEKRLQKLLGRVRDKIATRLNVCERIFENNDGTKLFIEYALRRMEKLPPPSETPWANESPEMRVAYDLAYRAATATLFAPQSTTKDMIEKGGELRRFASAGALTLLEEFSASTAPTACQCQQKGTCTSVAFGDKDFFDESVKQLSQIDKNDGTAIHTTLRDIRRKICLLTPTLVEAQTID